MDRPPPPTSVEAQPVPAPAYAYPRPSLPPPGPVVAPGPADVRNVKASCQFGLRQYMGLQQRRQRPDARAAELDARIRAQASVVVGDLRALQAEVRGLMEAAEGHRWRRWLLGGAIASLVPAVRRMFRRRGGDDDARVASNDTEHAFRKSKGLLARIRDGVAGGGRLARVACFVFAVLYVFQNEVTLRVARMMRKRIRRLCERVERGDADIDEGDVRDLQGWRWRILLW